MHRTIDFAWLIVVGFSEKYSKHSALGGKRWSQFLSFLVSRNIWATCIQNLGGFKLNIMRKWKIQIAPSVPFSRVSPSQVARAFCFSKVHLQMKFVPICLQGLETPQNTIFLGFLLARKKFFEKTQQHVRSDWLITTQDLMWKFEVVANKVKVKSELQIKIQHVTFWRNEIMMHRPEFGSEYLMRVGSESL